MPKEQQRPTPLSQVIEKLQYALKHYGDYDVIVEDVDGRMFDVMNFFYTKEDISKKRGARFLTYKQYPVCEKVPYIKIKLK